MTSAAEVLEAIVRHVSAGDTLQRTSPLVALATEALAAPALTIPSPPPARAELLPVRAGLTDDEKRIRRATLGSSEIASVCGVNPYATLHNVWLAKVHGVDFEGNEATTLGNILEPMIFAIYAERYDRVLRKGAYVVGPEPWMSATPDAYIEGGGLVEAKLVGLRSIFMWGFGNTDKQESDAIPLHYLCQAQWQMACTGEKFVDVSALMGTEFRSYTVRADVDVQRKLIARGRDFWERFVVTKKQPPVDGSDGAREMLRTLYPRSGADPAKADERLVELVEKLRAAREAHERATQEKTLRENEIKAELKDAGGAFSDDWRIRYSTTKAGTRPFVFEDGKKESGRNAV